MSLPDVIQELDRELTQCALLVDELCSGLGVAPSDESPSAVWPPGHLGSILSLGAGAQRIRVRLEAMALLVLDDSPR